MNKITFPYRGWLNIRMPIRTTITITMPFIPFTSIDGGLDAYLLGQIDAVTIGKVDPIYFGN